MFLVKIMKYYFKQKVLLIYVYIYIFFCYQFQTIYIFSVLYIIYVNNLLRIYLEYYLCYVVYYMLFIDPFLYKLHIIFIFIFLCLWQKCSFTNYVEIFFLLLLSVTLYFFFFWKFIYNLCTVWLYIKYVILSFVSY